MSIHEIFTIALDLLASLALSLVLYLLLLGAML